MSGILKERLQIENNRVHSQFATFNKRGLAQNEFHCCSHCYNLHKRETTLLPELLMFDTNFVYESVYRRLVDLEI